MKKWLYITVFTADLLYIFVAFFIDDLQIRKSLGYFLLCVSVVLPLFAPFFYDED